MKVTNERKATEDFIASAHSKAAKIFHAALEEEINVQEASEMFTRLIEETLKEFYEVHN